MKKVAVLFVLAVGLLAAILVLAGDSRAQAPGERQGVNIDFDTRGMNSANAEAERQARAVGTACGTVMTLFWLVLAVVSIASLWFIFVKAGKPGWAAIIPIYNAIVLLEICGRPIWWIVLLLIPCVSFVVALIVCIDLAKSFGKDVLFGIGIWLLGIIFLPLLAFGSARYQGPSAAA